MYESGENYLETILLLSRENESVRSIDVAKKLNFSKPSVSRAMGILKEECFIEMINNGEIILTEEGKNKAESILERHEFLTKFLIKTTGVGTEIAEKDACKIEHVISEEVFHGIKEFISSSL
ncbi:MAG: metal-dependent transcriptional regulator [Mobilitalea sp.]